MILLLLLAVSFTCDAAKIQISRYEGNHIKDIFSTLSSFKTNIISIISKGFLSHKKVIQPSYQQSYHLPHRQIHQDLPSHYLQQYHVNDSPFRPEKLHLEQLSFQVLDIEDQSGLGLIKKPKEVEEISSTMDPENIHDEFSEIVPTGPESFVDQERVNAGLEVATDNKEDKIKKIPADLWREDIGRIKTQCKKIKKVKVVKKKDMKAENVTPGVPELVIE